MIFLKQFNTIFKKCLVIISTLLLSGQIYAQTAEEVIAQLYKTYDSIPYLTFDTKYSYNTDTLYGNFEVDVVEGTYTMAGSKAKYNIGGIDFVQNDSIAIAIYHDEKTIIVSDPMTKYAGNILPLRQMIDSIISGYLEHYSINVNLTDSTGEISFVKSDSLAIYNRFSLYFNNDEKMINAIEYLYEETEVLDSAIGGVSEFVRQKKFRVDFVNYRMDKLSEEYYDVKNYVFFSEGVYKPVDRFRHYKVYNTKSVKFN